ncbi:vWA domain-containing protein [Candidatus Thiosymbion oneisti]|uniref:vWA domain-containing protein n=1 Tax=Candidatus Thiosymbion oneisti TaxID=589554 RepID=UPI000B7EC790|nr:vWA domain-containing protein [Candidatus Thiosymbion oneisti]
MLKTLLRTLLLILLGLSVLALMAGWVKLTQPQPGAEDPLRVTVPQDILWPWDQTELWIDYSGAEGKVQPGKPPPQTILFLLDTSGSMAGYLEDTKRAVFELQRNLAVSGNRPRIGVIEFASTASLVSPFTADMNELAARLRAPWPGAGGGTVFLAGLSEALAMLDVTGTTHGTTIMLTDGGAGEDDTVLARFFQNRWKPSGHELYLVGIGTGANDPASFYSLTDDPSRYIVSATDTGVIDLLFQEVAVRIGNALGRNVNLRLPLTEPFWDWGTPQVAPDLNAARTLLAPSTQDPERFHMPALFARPYQWRLPLEPKLSGILDILYAPPELRYTAGTEVFSVRPPRDSGPKVLVVTWLFLFMLMLPALIYLLAALLAWLLRPRAEIPALEPEPRHTEHRPPPPLPVRFPVDDQRIDWTPSLVIGLGRSGRAVLTHARQNLADSFDRAETRPLLLGLDLARDELTEGRGEPFPGCLEPLAADQVFLLPPGACALHEAVHQPRETRDDPAAALDLTPYQGMGADALRLSKGTQGQPPLARLALLNDLAEGAASALLTRLQQALEDWRRIVPEQRTRQIVLIANAQGGVGAGWLTDLLILMRRLVATDEAAGTAVEINVLLLGDERPKRGALVPMEAPVLFAELDRLAAAGSRPFRHRLAKPKGGASGRDVDPLAAILDGQVPRRPQDTVFVLPRRDPQAEDSYPAAADALMLLIDRRRRIELTQRLQALQGTESQRRAAEGRERYTQIAIHNAVFPRSFFRELLLNRLTNLIGHHQVLFPELRTEGGTPVLGKQPVDAKGLCSSDVKAAGLGVAAALGKAAGGNCEALRALAPNQDDLREAVNAVRLALIANANRGLRDREIGLLGLADAAGTLANRLTACAGTLGDSPLVSELAAGCTAIRRQALTWIEHFFGSQALVELGLDPVISGQTGLLAECSAASEQVVDALVAWARGSSRTLVGSVSAADLAERDQLDSKLDRLLQTFIQRWLATDTDPTDTNQVEALAARCGWELTVPGSNGQPMGIDLVLRGARTRRYAPSASELRRFEADLHDEATPVIDRSHDFHILSLLRAATQEDHERALVPFVERLKGPLRGEQSGLLATVPELHGINDPDLHGFRTQLTKTLTELTVNAAEQVRVISVRDRNRISVLQTLPLLRSDQQGPPGPALHHPERYLQHAARKLAQALGRTTIDLPAATGIALADPDRLRGFAKLYRNGQVFRHPMDGFWYVRDPRHLIRLTRIETQTLADAATYYVSHGLDIPVDPARSTAPDPYDGHDDFADYLAWLAEQ